MTTFTSDDRQAAEKEFVQHTDDTVSFASARPNQIAEGTLRHYMDQSGREIVEIYRNKQWVNFIDLIGTNAEPVAWMWNENGCDLGVVLTQDKQMGNEFKDYTIPLYTTPHHASDVKQTKPEGYGKAVPLSGEEILEIYESIWNRPVVVEDISFARAIEERILGK